MHLVTLLGHPSPNTFNDALASAYHEGAQRAGASSTLLRLHALDFDPVLRDKDQALEEDLLNAQRTIEEARHLTIMTPLWWGSVPALLKGFIDRTFQSGWAYRYAKGSTFQEPLLSGRSARIVLTMDGPTWWYRLRYGAPVHGALCGATLKFSGFSPVRSTSIGKVRSLDRSAREDWIEKMRILGASDVAKAQKSEHRSRPPRRRSGGANQAA